MAHFRNNILALSLAGLLAVPGVYASGSSLYDNDAPASSGNMLGAVNANPFSSIASLNGLAAGGLGNMNLGQMLMNTMVQQLTSKLLGTIDPSGMLGAVAAQGMTGQLGQLTSMGSTGLTSNLLGGGIQNAMNSSTLSFGGLVNAAVNAGVNAVVTKGVEMVTEKLGGISGGSGDSGTASIGGTADADMPALAYNAAIDATSENYTVGTYDAIRGLQPDSRYLMSSAATAAWDSNYMAGYKSGLLTAAAQ